MIISMKPGATRAQIQRVCDRIKEMDFSVRSIQGDERVVIAAVGLGDVTHAIEVLRSVEGVENGVPITAPYKLVSKQVKSDPTVVDLGRASIGGDAFAVIAGPCSVETEEQINACAAAVSKAGAQFLRGGAFKPRTSPYSFQGLKEQGLQLMREAADRHNLYMITEVMTVGDVELVSNYTDVLQVGARNVQNFPLLKAVGKHGKRPVLLKRGQSATIKEFLLSAEYIVTNGNPNVILCERGIRTFESATRNTLDINAVPVLNELTHLPVILDPAHATGRRDLIQPLVRAAVAVGADGVMVEVHPDPERAWSDGAQSLTFSQFDTIMDDIQPYLGLWNQARSARGSLAASAAA